MMALVGAVYAAPYGGGSYGGSKGYGGSYDGESGGDYSASSHGYNMSSSVRQHWYDQSFDSLVLTMCRPDTTCHLHP